jgi:ferredoxin-NADP reductase
MLGKNFITTLTDEKKRGYENGRIDYTFLKKKDNFKQHFYVCGPPQFVTAFQRRSPN